MTALTTMVAESARKFDDGRKKWLKLEKNRWDNPNKAADRRRARKSVDRTHKRLVSRKLNLEEASAALGAAVLEEKEYGRIVRQRIRLADIAVRRAKAAAKRKAKAAADREAKAAAKRKAKAAAMVTRWPDKTPAERMSLEKARLETQVARLADRHKKAAQAAQERVQAASDKRQLDSAQAQLATLKRLNGPLSEDTCGICMDESAANIHHMLCCKHTVGKTALGMRVICGECIQSILGAERSPTCPWCRAIIVLAGFEGRDGAAAAITVQPLFGM